MAKLKYFYDLLSQPSRAMYMILKMSGTKFESVPVALRKFEQMSDDYKKNVNRFQKVPCIIYDDFKLSESVAILRFLAHEGKISTDLYPNKYPEKALVDEYLEWQHLNTRLYSSMYFVKKFLEPVLLEMEEDLDDQELYYNRLHQTLDTIENVWLANNKFLTSDKLTAADIFAACEIFQTILTNFDVTEKRPKLSAWLKTVKEASNPHFDEAHVVVYKMAQKFGIKPTI